MFYYAELCRPLSLALAFFSCLPQLALQEYRQLRWLSAFFVLMYPHGLKLNVTYFTIIGHDSDQKTRVAPTGLIFNFTFSQGSATLHPGLSCGRASGAWFVVVPAALPT